MKRLYTIVILMLSLIVESAAQHDAIYIYHNDGQFDAFLKTSIDSITYSHYDKDSIQHDTWQTQVIYTADSIYQIPLAAIESVELVTPKPVYKANVVILSEKLSEYIIECSSNSITFSSDIPSALIPKVGQILATDIHDNAIESEFSGRVTSIKTNNSNIICECEAVGLYDIYERLLVVGQAKSYIDNNASLSKSRTSLIGKNIGIALPPNISLSASFKDVDLWKNDCSKVNINGNFSIELQQPSLTLDYIICIGEENLKDFVRFKSRLNSEGSFGINGEIKGEIAPDPWLPIGIPFNVCGIAGAIDLGFFINTSGSLDVSSNFPFHFDTTFGFEYKEGEGFSEYPENPRRNAGWGTPDLKLSLDGEIFFGFASKLSIGILHKGIVSADITTYLGPKFSASFTLASSQDGISNTMYDLLSNSEVKSSVELSVEPGYKVFFKDRESFGVNANFVLFEKSSMLIPTIDTPDWKSGKERSGTLSASIYNDSFFPVKVGWEIYDGNILTQKKYFDGNYQSQEKWDNPSLIYNVFNLPKEYNYKAYPIIKLFDTYEMRVPEYATMSSKKEEKTNVTTGSSKIKYLTRAYVNVSVSGLQYLQSSYKIGVVYGTDKSDLTVDYDADVVYTDVAADGTYTIDLGTLKDYSTTYYYRACLITGDTIYYGDIKNFTTRNKITGPTEGTMIDLGLSVKWARCNLDAFSPYEQGSHYAWGETEIKSYYSKDNYDTHNWNIFTKPNCISGTAYDAATAKLGDKWRMPTLEEVQELERECIKTELYTGYWGTTREKGYLFIGPNGNSIFLPYGDRIWDGNVTGADHEGEYYTGTAYESYGPVYMFDVSTRPLRGLLSGYEGLMIRPVYGDLPEKSK